MCKTRRNNNGVKVLKQHDNWFTGTRVQLTRMTAKSGTIVYAVMAKHKGRAYIVDGHIAGHEWNRFRIKKYETIGMAWEQYKKAVA